MPEPSSFTFQIDDAQRELLRDKLAVAGFEFRDVPYTHYGAKLGKLSVNAYTSGKLLVQGKGAREFVEFTIEPEILGEARVGYEEVHSPEMFETHAGIDESGKGDFFGPLVIAGVIVNPTTARELLDAGVKDSKRLTSDKKAEDLAEVIRDIVGDARSVVAIGPAKYNQLYRKFGNLNKLLAWGHATVIENLLEKDPKCPRALSDKFGDSRLIQRALKERGQGIELEQKTKAESDIAVAAASILARAVFVERLRKLGDGVGQTLAKGASAKVKEVAREVAREHGADGLRGVAKEHFKTFGEVLGSL